MVDFQSTKELLKGMGFLSGIAKSVDIFGSITISMNHLYPNEEYDTQAIQSDWQAVGDDIRTSISRFENKKRRSLVKR